MSKKKAERVNQFVPLDRFPYKPVPALAGPINMTTTLFYDGKELRPFEGRPGSMDFKKCPSKGF